MKLLRLLGLLVFLASLTSPAHAACPPARLVLSTIREARTVQVLRLAPRHTRELDWESDDPDLFLGYEVLDSNPLLPAEASAFVKLFSSPGSYDCKSASAPVNPIAAAVDVGFAFHSEVAAVRAVLHVNEQQVELEFINGAHTRSGLSLTAHKRFESLLDAYAIRTAGSRKAWNERMGGAPPALAPPPPDSPEAAKGVDVMPENRRASVCPCLARSISTALRPARVVKVLRHACSFDSSIVTKVHKH